MSEFKNIFKRVDPHPLRALMWKYKIPLIRVAKYCGVSYWHMSHLLSNFYTPGKKTQARMDKLYQHLLKKEQESHEN